MAIDQIRIHKRYLFEFTQECLSNARQSVMGYQDSKNLAISMQQMNQAYICAKMIQSYYLQNCYDELPLIEDFLYRFTALNEEFLSAVRTEHSLQASVSEFIELEQIFHDFKEYLNL